MLIDSLIKEAEEVGMEIEEAIRNGVQVGTVDWYYLCNAA